MPLCSPVVFPLFPVIDGKCGCHTPDCGRVGKHPAIPWKDLRRGDPVPRPVEGAGYGIKTGAVSDIFVVDIDGLAAFEEWGRLGGLFETYIVDTPRGLHLYFEHPGFPVKTCAGALAKGIDIRGEGGFVVGPGSPHASGFRYYVLSDCDPAAAPEWLLEWLRANQPKQAGPPPAPVEPGSPEEAARIEEAIKMLRSAPEAIAGQKGHGTLWVIAQRLMRSFELPLETAYALLCEHYNPRCVPPWSARELRHKLAQARDRGRFELRSDIDKFNAALLGKANEVR